MPPSTFITVVSSIVLLLLLVVVYRRERLPRLALVGGLITAAVLAILAGRTLLLDGASLTETAWTLQVVTTANFSASAGIFAWMLVWSLRSRAPSRSEDPGEEHAG